MTITQIILLVAAAYTLIGVVFAAAFVARGVARVDPAARGGTVGFRILIFPGAAALWPLLFARWMRAPKHGEATDPAAHSAE